MTIADFEQGKRSPLRNNLIMIRQAFEQQGITFIEENGGPPGLREPRHEAQPASESESSLTSAATELVEKKTPSGATPRRTRSRVTSGQ